MALDWMDQMVSDLIRDEGEVLHLYYDSVGVPTIGVGFNLRDVVVPQEIRKEITISKDASRVLLLKKLEEVLAEVQRALPWIVELDDVRQRVLVNMAYNLGIGGLLLFQNTLAAVKAGQWSKARQGMLDSKWAKQVGERAQRLAEQMYTGKD